MSVRPVNERALAEWLETLAAKAVREPMADWNITIESETERVAADMVADDQIVTVRLVFRRMRSIDPYAHG